MLFSPRFPIIPSLHKFYILHLVWYYICFCIFLPSDLVLCKEPFLQEQPLSHWILDLETDHCVKSVPIRSFLRSVFWRIWTEYNNIRIRKNSVFGLFNYEPTMLKIYGKRCFILFVNSEDLMKAFVVVENLYFIA